MFITLSDRTAMAKWTFSNYVKHTALKAIEKSVFLFTYWVFCPGCSETFPSHIQHCGSVALASDY